MQNTGNLRQESAEILALQALGWLLSRDDLVPQFMAATGASADDLRALAADAGFLGAVLDFLLTDDQMVQAFADDAGVAPDLPMRARAALPGGMIPDWT
jgi:hypothetical protein